MIEAAAMSKVRIFFIVSKSLPEPAEAGSDGLRSVFLDQLDDERIRTADSVIVDSACAARRESESFVAKSKMLIRRILPDATLDRVLGCFVFLARHLDGGEEFY